VLHTMQAFSCVTDAGIEHLASHKHVPADYTPLDYMMEPFWVACTKCVPPWISPNAVSLFGGVCGLLSAVCSVIASVFNVWELNICAAICIFVYMTADAIDGKHARRTGQASPMGALVDHGVDAFIAFTTGVSMCITVYAELTTITMCAFCGFHTVWYVAQWAELELGVLDTRGITEAEFGVMFFLSLPAFISDVYALPVTLSVFGLAQPVPVYIFIHYGIIMWAGATAVFQLLVVMSKGGVKHWMPLLHVVMHTVVAACVSRTPLYTGLYSRRLMMFILVGMNACQLMTKIRFVASTHSPWPMVHVEVVPFLLLMGAVIAGAEVNEWLLAALFMWQLVALAFLWYDTISRICTAFKIPFLAPVPKKD